MQLPDLQDPISLTLRWCSVDPPLTLGWYSIDTHFPDRAGSMSLSRWSIKVASTVLMYNNEQVSDQLLDLDDQRSSVLCWCIFSDLRRESVAFCFAYRGSLSLIYECLYQIDKHTNNDARPNIVDAPLRYIFRMGQEACRFLFWV